ncbi:MAG: hypothetical protein HUJ68_09535 [Clostridia bacterium]|nr:hypothetical protein [Clostridia bacterium]
MVVVNLKESEQLKEDFVSDRSIKDILDLYNIDYSSLSYYEFQSLKDDLVDYVTKAKRDAQFEDHPGWATMRESVFDGLVRIFHKYGIFISHLDGYQIDAIGNKLIQVVSNQFRAAMLKYDYSLTSQNPKGRYRPTYR